MSKPNKANKNNYMQAGRLTPDDMARERSKQHNVRAKAADERRQGRGERASTRPRNAREE
jgi:hypothetical protein